MNVRLRKSLIAAATAAPLLLASLASDAGSQSGGSAYCAKFSAGGGYCYGTMQGFRTSSDATAYAMFESMAQSGTTSPSFQAEYGGQYFYCIPPTSGVNQAVMAATWPQTMALRGWFWVEWDANGYCNSVEFLNGSQYAPY
jgi:hypothetical protein